MRTTSYPILLLFLVLACGAPAPDSETPPPATTAGENEVRVYFEVPEFTLTDHLGQSFGSDELRGRVWIANFIFTRCLAICPAMTQTMTKIQAELHNHRHADDIRLVSFSVDPENDTVETLRAYARDRAYAFDDRWRFLTGERETIWTLCEEGLKLPVDDAADDAAMPILHSQKFVLVDHEGRIRGYYDALTETERAELYRDLEIVLDEPSDARPVAEVSPPKVPYPEGAFDPPWLEPRRRAQIDGAAELEVFHDFGFSDRIEESGIAFVHRIVDDAGPNYMGVHYDHGNGVAVADVDGDGLHDVYFVTQLGRNQLWRNLGDGRFEDATMAAGVGLGERISVTASFADVDNDGDPDLFVTTVRDGNVLFVNDGAGRFEDRSAAAGLDYRGYSSGAVFFDYDRDGLLDLFVTNIGRYTSDDRGPGGYLIGYQDAFGGHLHPDRTEHSLLYRNQGGARFADVTEAVGLVDGSWSGDASPIDLNVDGYPDLYVLDMQGHDEYFENVEGKRFVKKSREVFPRTPWGSMGIKVFDFDNDGLMDVFLSDMHSDMSQKVGPGGEKLKADIQWPESVLRSEGLSIWGNALFHNRGDGSFAEVSDAMGTENYWPWGLSVGDLNADGYDDVLLTSSMNYPWRYGVNTLLLNDRGRRFVDAEFLLGIEPRKDGRTVTPWFTLDCAGDLTAHPLFPMVCAGREGVIEVQGALGSRSSVLFDLDRDGDLDVVTNEFHSEPMVLVSDLAERTDLRYLEVDLTGTASNRDGLGARVTVMAGGERFLKVYDGKSGYLSQSSYPLYFGLGGHAEVEKIEVVWPSGKTQTVAGPIAANQRLEITEE